MVFLSRRASCLSALYEPATPGHFEQDSRVAQWKRAGPITQRSVDRNHALLTFYYYINDVYNQKIILPVAKKYTEYRHYLNVSEYIEIY